MRFIANIFWSHSEQRLRSGWRILIFLGGFFVTLVLVTIGFSTAAFGFGLVNQDELDLATQRGIISPALQLISGAAALVATVGCMAFWGRVLDRRSFAEFGFHLNRRWWLDFGFGLLLGALLMTGIFLFELAAGWLTITELFQSIQPDRPFLLSLLTPLLLFLTVGFWEEMVFRGYLLKNLAEGLNLSPLGPYGAIVIAWLISSLLFGLLHNSNPNASLFSTTSLVLAGLFLGLGYVLTGELALPIGLHISWNFFQGNVYGFPVSGGNFTTATVVAIEQGGPDLITGGPFGPEAGLIGILAILLGSWLIAGWVAWSRGRLQICEQLARPPYRRAEVTPAQSETISPKL